VGRTGRRSVVFTAEGMPIRANSPHLGVGRHTVRRALAADEPPKYRRPAKGRRGRAGAADPGVAEGPADGRR